MKLKKIAASLLLGATLAAGSAVCGAEGLDWITPQDMSLGGVEPGCRSTMWRASTDQ